MGDKIPGDLCATPGCKHPRPKHPSGRGRLKLCYYCRHLRYRKRNPIRVALNVLKQSAKRRGIPVNLTFEEWKQWCQDTNYLETKGRGKGA